MISWTLASYKRPAARPVDQRHNFGKPLPRTLRKSDKVAITLALLATCESRYAKCISMLDHESITIHATQIDGQSYPDDYTVIWRGLPIGRIRKNPGLPDYVDQWSWGCNVYGQPSVTGDSGQGTDLEDCKAKFKAAWARVRSRTLRR